MKVFPIIVCMLSASVVAAHAASDADSTRTQSAFVTPLSRGLLLSRFNAADSYAAPMPNYLAFSLSPFATQPYVPQSFFDAALYGAGTAGTLAMFLGAIGNTLGAFDEDTTWIMTGAAAAAGALYSVSHFSVRMSLGPDEWTPRPPSDH